MSLFVPVQRLEVVEVGVAALRTAKRLARSVGWIKCMMQASMCDKNKDKSDERMRRAWEIYSADPDP